MSVGGPIFLLAAIWSIIHVLHRIATRNSSSVLPTFGTATRRRSLFSVSHHTKVTLNHLHLRISTTRWNVVHDKMAGFLVKRDSQKLSIFIRELYNFASLLGAVGMLTAVAALCWLCSTSVWTLLERYIEKFAYGIPETPNLPKRSLEYTMDEQASITTRFPVITPIIPGVTVPLGHLPLIVLAVFISQVVHELGHAIAAARESLPLLEAGASFIVCIPAAFVTFPVSGTKGLNPKARSRVVAAGSFHNLAFWCLLVLASRLRVVNVVGLISGYKNISAVGKIVVDVNADSPLYLHVPPGSIIKELNDTPLSSLNSSSDTWTEYLTGKQEKLTLGWCVSWDDFETPETCCDASSKQSSLTCFVASETYGRGCINPVPILTKPTEAGRCAAASDCPRESLCAFPKPGVELTRLRVILPNTEHEEESIVLWSGPPEEIYDEVEVTNWRPRIWLLPLWIPPLVESFWEYLMMATLSLYFFNLLPLPYLDGTELLRAFLEITFEEKLEAAIYDVEALEGGEEVRQGARSRTRWKERIMSNECPGLRG